MARPTLGEPIRHYYTGVQKRLSMAQRFLTWRDARVLDVGCGNGAYTVVIAQEAAYVLGADIERHRLHEFANWATVPPNVRIAQAAAEFLPAPDESYEIVFCIETLEHVIDERRALREIWRVLQPGGSVLLTVPNKWYLFETHGLRAKWLKGSNRYPFASWLPRPIHRRLANARIYTAQDVRQLLTDAGFGGVQLDWMLPPLDKVNPKPLRRLLRTSVRAVEATFVRRFGVSIVAVASKPADRA